MNRKYFFIILIITLLCLSLIMIYFEHEGSVVGKEEKEREATQVVRPPFHTYISGVGIVEPKSGNIYIGIPFNRIAEKVNVAVNDRVKKGDVLVELDHHDLTANLQVKQSEYEKALANLNKLKEMPRKEDLVAAEEALKKAQIGLNEAKAQYERTLNLPNPNAIKKEERDRRLYSYQQAQADFKEAEASYEKIKAGAWKPDVTIALYQVEQAKADLEALKAEIERTYIRAPIDGTIIQIKIHEGEVPDAHSQPAITIGNTDELHLRVSIDQFNVDNFNPKAQAVAYRQGTHSHPFPLEFIHIEPVMIPKKYVTNAVEEQVDTKVLEILYRITKDDSDLFIGEQMNVFIDQEK